MRYAISCNSIFPCDAAGDCMTPTYSNFEEKYYEVRLDAILFQRNLQQNSFPRKFCERQEISQGVHSDLHVVKSKEKNNRTLFQR